jgi:hypothetical protein
MTSLPSFLSLYHAWVKDPDLSFSYFPSYIRTSGDVSVVKPGEKLFTPLRVLL